MLVGIAIAWLRTGSLRTSRFRGKTVGDVPAVKGYSQVYMSVCTNAFQVVKTRQVIG